MAEHWCSEHNVAFRKYEKDGKSWYSHKTNEGAWCNELKREAPKTVETPEPRATRELTPPSRETSIEQQVAIKAAVELIVEGKYEEPLYHTVIN